MIDWSSLPTSNRLRNVGKRLASGTASDSDLADLGSYQRLADEVQRQATDQLRAKLLRECNATSGVTRSEGEVQLQVMPGRAKTMRTLVDKLKRMPSCPLANIRDVAGVRIVVDGGLAQQDLICDVAVRLLHEGGASRMPRLIDHRSEPVCGYRALHAEVRVGRMPLEIQVRTAMQEEWARLFERIADDWGRQIRYGGEPDDGHPIAAQCLGIMEQISKNIAGIEKSEGSLVPLRVQLEELPPSVRSPLRDPVMAQLETVRAVLADERLRLQSTLTELAELIDRENETAKEGV